LPGSTQKLTTAGTGKDVDLATLRQGNRDPRPSFAITLRADPNNSSSAAIYAGRQNACEPLYADDSRTYYSCRNEELIINDQGTANLILYVDDSGPMDPAAQYATVVLAPGYDISAGVKAPNDPTP